MPRRPAADRERRGSRRRGWRSGAERFPQPAHPPRWRLAFIAKQRFDGVAAAQAAVASPEQRRNGLQSLGERAETETCIAFEALEAASCWKRPSLNSSRHHRSWCRSANGERRDRRLRDPAQAREEVPGGRRSRPPDADLQEKEPVRAVETSAPGSATPRPRGQTEKTERPGSATPIPASLRCHSVRSCLSACAPSSSSTTSVTRSCAPGCSSAPSSAGRRRGRSVPSTSPL